MLESALDAVSVKLNLETPYCSLMCTDDVFTWISINSVNGVFIPNEEQKQNLKAIHFYKKLIYDFKNGQRKRRKRIFKK